ncbi:MAG: hypothetical protein ABSA57_03490 [Candidatus Acidiferrales bacterium]
MVKPSLFVLGGVVLILLGIGALIRPNVMMPAKRQDLMIQGQRVKIETRRVVAIPRPLSALVIVCGMGFILLRNQER